MGRKDVALSFHIQTFYGHKLNIGTKFTVLSVMHDKQEKKHQNNSSWKEYRGENNQRFTNKCSAQKQISDGVCSNLLINKGMLLSRTL